MWFFIGLIVGVAIGTVGLVLLNMQHKKTKRRLLESRRKLERQRTQAVNELFSLQNLQENSQSLPKQTHVEMQPSHRTDPKMNAENIQLKALIARADTALTTARTKRAADKEKIIELENMLGQNSGQVAS